MQRVESSPNVSELLRQATARLSASGSARLDAELLLGAVLQRPRAWLLAHDQAEVPQDQAARFRALTDRRARGEPLAYITGSREFWSLTLQVDAAVLVPRPETELLVERALALLADVDAAVADLGTGSGAIALACASERPRWRIVATDRSTAALAVARRNAVALSADNIEFLAGDWFVPLAGRRFRMILANPPYIASGDPALRDPALRHEPRSALVSGATGLEALAAIARDAPRHLLPDGVLLLEHGADQAAAVAEMLVSQGFAHVRCHSDLAGRSRITEAHRL